MVAEKSKSKMESRSMELFSSLVKLSLEYPELTPDRVLIIDMKRETFQRVLSPSRMDLIRVVREAKPESVGALAKALKRPVESVSRDLKALSNYGVLEFVQDGKAKRPVIEKDMILIPLTA